MEKATYGVKGKDGILTPVAEITVVDSDYKVRIINNLVNLIAEETIVYCVENRGNPKFKTVKDLLACLKPDKCLSSHTIFKCDKDNLNPENWEVIYANVKPDNVEKYILGHHESLNSYDRDNTCYPIITVIEVR
jgi:hypothetical protein